MGLSALHRHEPAAEEDDDRGTGEQAGVGDRGGGVKGPLRVMRPHHARKPVFRRHGLRRRGPCRGTSSAAWGPGPHAHTHVYTHADLHRHACRLTQTRAHAHVHTGRLTHTHTRTHTCIHTRAHMHMCTQADSHTYTYMHTRAYIHTGPSCSECACRRLMTPVC